MYASEIIGKEVLDKDANRLGKIIDIKIDLPKGVVESIIVKVGLTKKLDIKVSSIEKSGDRVVLNTNREEIENTRTNTGKTVSL